MNNHLTIGQLSETLGIEKSTLRYWDSQGIITLTRNDSNNYREYSKQDITEISDIAFYRSIDMPIKQCKEINQMPVEQLKETFEEIDQKITEEIKELEKKRASIKARKKHIQSYYELVKEPYRREKTDIQGIRLFDFSDKQAWAECLYDPYRYSVFIRTGEEKVHNGYVVTEPGENDLWENNHETTYLTFAAKFVTGHYEENDLQVHLEQLRNLGYETGHMVGRYLFSAYDGKKYDYHKMWIEVL